MAEKKDRLLNGFYNHKVSKHEKEDNVVASMSIGRYYTQGGCMFEIGVKFYVTDMGSFMRLAVTSDTFLHLHRFQKVLDALQDYARNHGGRDFGYMNDISPAQFVVLLEGLGYRDIPALIKAEKIAA